MRRNLALCAALAGALVASAAPAQPAPPAPSAAAAAVPVASVPANLNITPRRVTFDRTRRSATVYIFNQGGTPTTVDVTVVDRVMMPDGQIMTAADASKTPAQKLVTDKLKSARDMVQVAPRRVELEPGKGQTIRLRIGNVPADTDAAEYRTHLTVTTIPSREAGVTAEEAAKSTKDNRLTFRIDTVYGLSIPVIIRTGTPAPHAAIENAHVVTEEISLDGHSAPKPTPILVVDLVRGGANSLYGNLEVRPVGGRGDPIGAARNVGVYPEIDRRTIRIPLNHAPKTGEKLEVTFTDDDTSPGKVLAKSVL